jgi:TPR repeat protein
MKKLEDANKEKALELLRLAAQQGGANAQFELARELEPNFWDVDIDPKVIDECVKWYRLSAEQGHASAQSALGGIYSMQSSEYRDEREAIKWYEMAAEQGDAWAVGQVGDMYYSIAQETKSHDEFKKARFWNNAALEEFGSRCETERFTDEYSWYLPRAKNLIAMYREGLGGAVDRDEAGIVGGILNFLVLENEKKSEYEEEMSRNLTEYTNDFGEQSDPNWGEDE